MAYVLAAAVAALFVACGISAYPDRDPATVENIRVENARFLPLGGRYILADSATGIRFGGVRTGFECSEILAMGLAESPVGSPPAFLPHTRVRLPAAPDCAVDSAGRDTTITGVFPAGPDTVRLANSAGLITDSAALIRGTLGFFILAGVPGIAGTISSGPWTFRDSSGLAPRQIYADSLPSCRHLNHATFSRSKDTVTVRLSFVTLDSAAAADTCRGPAHADSLALTAASP